MTAVLLTLFALVLAGYVALPLLFPGQADPLPDPRDPVTLDLEEEREALFRAIRELDARDDLPEARRTALRRRYEAKAAQVLRSLDAREEQLSGQPVAHPAGARRPPYALLTLLLLVIASAVGLGNFVLPRVGGSTITSFFEGDLEAGRALQELRRIVDRNPSAENLMALADAYWQLGEAEGAEATYRRIVAEIAPVPGLAYRRLGFLTLQTDLGEAKGLLELARAADPSDLDTLFALGELNFALGRRPEAREAWESFLAQPGGAGNPDVVARLELIDATEPLYEAVEREPSEANRLALADALWRQGERERAVEIYFRILTETDPDQPEALSRTGQLLFFRGRVDDAVAILERARSLGADDPETLLILGNAYFGLELFADAVAVWEAYLEVADDPGRVPDLLASARARLEGGSATGEQLYAAHCATCHGATGQGGSAPPLAGNRNAERQANVLEIIRFGRGLMPGFGPTLGDDEIERVADFVVTTLAPRAATP